MKQVLKYIVIVAAGFMLTNLFFVFSLQAASPYPFSISNNSANEAQNNLCYIAYLAGLTNETCDSYDLIEIVGNIINILLSVTGIIFFITMLWSGGRWMTSGGNEKIVSEAKLTIRNALLALQLL